MSTTGAHTKAENSFDRQLAELNAGLARLEASLGGARPPATGKPRSQPHTRVKPQSRKRTPVRASDTPVAAPSVPAPVPPIAEPPPPPVPAQQPPAPPIPPATPPQPTGTDLADPKNFGLMPPSAELDRGAASPEEYRTRLARHLAFATKVLHTSRVPATIWREWRAFEKAAQERLRELAHRRPHND